MPILNTYQLSKSYGQVQALKEVTFEVPAGCVFGILGPNGSGKTTLLGTVLETLYPTSGRFQWFGESSVNSAAQRHRIGTLLETPNFYPYLTGAQNLAVTASIRGRGQDQIEEVLRRVGLYEARAQKFATYSLGMKQRLAIGAALLGDPEVLVLDEPTNGLDPAGIADVRRVVGSLKDEGKTVILASHLLDEVEKVCTHVAILKKGRLLEYGTMENVLKEETTIEVRANDLERLQNLLQAHSPALSLSHHEGAFQVTGAPSAEDLNRYCFEHGLVLSCLRTNKRDLESRFLEMTDDD